MSKAERHSLKPIMRLLNSPFKPHRTCTTRKEIEMTQNSGAAILVIQKFVHEKMHNCSKWVYGKVSDIFCECEESEGGAE